jgi:TRAP-type C4-dicarboxylate transport system substrate-binding protein
MRAGAPIAQNSDAARMGNYVPEFAALNCPYFVETLEEVEKLNELQIIKDWKKRLEDEHGIHVLSFFYVQGERHFLTNVPVKKPADLAGLRIRTAPAPAWQESVRALGAVPVSMPYTEVYSGIQTKAVDGCENVYVASYHSSMYEVLKYLSETGHILLMNFSVTSAEWFKSLPEEYRKIIDEECQNAGKRVSYAIRDKYSAEARDAMKAKGMTIIPAAEIDLDAFREAGKKAYEVLGLTGVREEVYRQLGKK